MDLSANLPHSKFQHRMAFSCDCEALTKALSGSEVDEKSLITITGKWDPEQRNSYRKGTPNFFTQDDRLFERWDDRHVSLLETWNDRRVVLLEREFSRFKHGLVLWITHPWERDARLAKMALELWPQKYKVLIEIACTRSSEELLGARRAYHSLYHLAIEEDVAFHVHGCYRKLLVALLSSYRYEGPEVNENVAHLEAKELHNALESTVKRKPVEDEEIIRILSTRSKPHLKAIFNHYKEIYVKNIEEDVEARSTLQEPVQDVEAYSTLKETVQCLCTPQTYFSKVLDTVLKNDADDYMKEALTRVIVTRADVDMKEIKEDYHKRFGVPLSKKIEDITNGNYKDFLLTLVARM